VDKGILIVLAVGLGLAYLIVGFVGKLQNEDDRLISENQIQAKQDMAYYKKDVVGNDILVFKNEMPDADKIAVWKRSSLHRVLIELFPNFSGMKEFINDRILDDDFKQKFLKYINTVEDGYFSGSLNADQAKEKIDQLEL
jgi:hypothetical protein